MYLFSGDDGCYCYVPSKYIYLLTEMSSVCSSLTCVCIEIFRRDLPHRLCCALDKDLSSDSSFVWDVLLPMEFTDNILIIHWQMQNRFRIQSQWKKKLHWGKKWGEKIIPKSQIWPTLNQRERKQKWWFEYGINFFLMTKCTHCCSLCDKESLAKLQMDK